ncbi:MAG: HNH endonuclease signature motif containing protein [Dehalococcoidia bacterium]
MRDNIVSYFEMCQREGTSLQRGMNFRLHGKHSVILMSVQPNAPYRDRIEDDGAVLIYEGHDVPRTSETPDPKRIDQPEFLPARNMTENGKFHRAAQEYRAGKKGPDIVRVYEKIKKGIWSDNGYFHLVDSWREHDGIRHVFKFKLIAVEDVPDDEIAEDSLSTEAKPSRIIPTSVKLEVWARDRGKCVLCGATDELHFDHIVPFSKGGTSLKADNIQLLCARHNLQKHDRIE